METISPKSKNIAQPLTKNDLQKIVLAIFRRVPAGEGMSSVTPFYIALDPCGGRLVLPSELIEARTSHSLIANVCPHLERQILFRTKRVNWD